MNKGDVIFIGLMCCGYSLMAGAIIGIVCITNSPITEHDVFDYISDESPSTKMLEANFNARYSVRQGMLIDALDNLITDGLITYEEVGGYTRYVKMPR